MKVVLRIIVLGWLGVMIGSIIKDRMEDLRRFREQDRQYRMALSYIRRYHKHGYK